MFRFGIVWKTIQRPNKKPSSINQLAYLTISLSYGEVFFLGLLKHHHASAIKLITECYIEVILNIPATGSIPIYHC